MFTGLLTTTICSYWGGSQRRCVGLMQGTTLQILGRDTAITVEIVGAFKTETRRGRTWDLTTWIRERNGMNLALTCTKSTGDTTEMGSSAKNDLHKTWLTECLLIEQIQTYMMCYVAIVHRFVLRSKIFKYRKSAFRKRCDSSCIRNTSIRESIDRSWM